MTTDFNRVSSGPSKLREIAPPLALPMDVPAAPGEPPSYVTVASSDAQRAGTDYDISRDAAEAVNVALALGQPLLVTGEPGCGKTDLAYGVALQLGLEHLWRYDTHSTSTADDLFYRFDNLSRFHDAGAKSLRPTEDYVELQALGAAVVSKTTQVVLIDEIDKAPRELPNDLLARIEEPMRFRVREVPKAPEVRQRARHLVVVTSNGERELPDPFLRRCVFLHMEFPKDAETLIKIVSTRLGKQADVSVIKAATARFLEVRERLARERPDARKPSTSELIQWARALLASGRGVGKGDDLPLHGALLKQREERDAVLGKKQ